MSWIILIFAGLFEVAGVTGMTWIGQGKKVRGWLTLCIGFPISLGLLSLAMETIALGVAYAVWTGIGTIGSALVGIIFYKESASYKRVMYLSIIVIAVVGLRIFG
ncbi:multidrug efflux SMR transporter [Jeotgalicoccus huakuii]|nr:multidrug efflux SMR transporter [Jeotgalicoccus huakuii]